MYVIPLTDMKYCHTDVMMRLQVAAVVAVMEAVRSEGGLGVFANELYAKLLTIVATSAATKPEVGSVSV